ncbi:hypothetical protein MKK55_11485 [Methylobacterium sp. J-059]|uniref:hypothetical protein n=1 Tax=Methylobacterium sp. J-059 TaxID=2836643 RepID=UPI001FBBB5CA|nr:hypothetical protein [Methylobacterium sp. J-059]MCJ2039558.1 hypothetical protein [Methylobacterium sp. J-059]
MTPREQAAFAAGIQAARQAAMTAAVTIEVRDDARELRQQAAAAALHGLAAGLKVAFLDPQPAPRATPAMMAAIAADPAQSGDAPCSECSGRFRWTKDSTNGHVHGRCEACGMAIMQ